MINRLDPLASAVAVLVCCASADVHGQVTATYTGPSGGSYNDPDHWDVGVVPINGETTYNVVIPPNIVVDFDVPELVRVVGLHLDTGARLDLDLGERFETEGFTIVNGLVTANGDGTSLMTDEEFTVLENARAFATEGGSVRFRDETYTWRSGGTRTLFDADGTGSTVDLSAVEILDANVSGGSCFGSTKLQYVYARNDGVVDLGALASVIGGIDGCGGNFPARIHFILQEGGTIDLSSIVESFQNVTFHAQGESWVIPIQATNTGTVLRVDAPHGLDLPLWEDSDRTQVVIADGARIDAPSLASFTGSTLNLNPDRTFVFDTLGNIDNSRIRLSGGIGLAGSITDTEYVWRGSGVHDVFDAADAGTILDLSSLLEIDANVSGGNCFGSTKVQYITARDLATIDLGNVEVVTGGIDGCGGNFPARMNLVARNGGQLRLDALAQATQNVTFRADDSSLALPSLATVRGGSGTVRFEVTTFQSIDLPSIEAMSGAVLSLEDAATIDAPNLDSFERSFVHLNPVRIFDTADLVEIDDSEIHVSGGLVYDRVVDAEYVWRRSGDRNVFRAVGAGSLLDLSSFRVIDAAVSGGNCSGSTKLQRIDALDLGTIDFGDVTSIIGGVDGCGGNFPARIFFNARNGGRLLFGNLEETSRNVTFTADGIESLVAASGDFTMTSASSVVRFTGEATLRVGADLSMGRIAASSWSTGGGVLHMSGGGRQRLEVAGQDNGVPDDVVSGNFEWGRLMVGSPTDATTVHLADAIDHQGVGEPDALYLNGFPQGVDALRIGPGSTLVLDGINLYFARDNTWVHANTLFQHGEEEIPFDEGTLRLEDPCPNDLDGSGAVDFGDLVMLLAAWGECSQCPEDLDDNGVVDVREILTVLAAWGPCR